MPPDVRQAYEAALASLSKSLEGGGGLVSLLEHGAGTSIKATFREIVVNGKKYGSVDEMPPEIRRTYEEAMAGLDPGGATRGMPTAPSPIIVDDDAGGGGGGGGGKLLRIGLWIAIAVLVAVWLLRRR